EGELVREIGGRYRAYVAAVDRLMAFPQAERKAVYFGELLPAFTQLKDRIQTVLSLNQGNMENADRATRAIARRTVQTAIAVSLAVVLFAIWFAWWLPR